MNKNLEIMAGKLTLPTITGLREICSGNQYREIENMFTAMWNSYLLKGKDNSISLPYWAKRVANPKALNIVLIVLSKAGWITTLAADTNNWAEAILLESKLLEYVEADKLVSVRKYFKFSKYILKMEETAKRDDLTRVNGKAKRTGLVRPGFTATANTVFNFDTIMMKAHRAGVIQLVNKGIDKMAEEYPAIYKDLANYGSISEEIVDHYIYSNSSYTSGSRYSDTRGRNIAGYLNKVGNPVGFKVMRALLVINRKERNKATADGLNNKYLFIAELLGFKTGTAEDKINIGRSHYINRDLLEDTVEELPENIWLERTYTDIDNAMDGFMGRTFRTRYNKYLEYANGSTWHQARAGKLLDDALSAERAVMSRSTHKWTVPVEIDMSASVLGYIGLLLGHKPFMERTNMIGDTLTDAWAHKTITNRLQFKSIMRQCYGSQLSAKDMWKAMKIPFTQEEVVAFNAEIETGDIAVAIKFKDFCINNCNMQPTMKFDSYDEQYIVPCNKFHNIGNKTIKYSLYDTYSNRIKTVTHTDTVKKPDLNRFKKFTVTGLIHNRDSIRIDATVLKVMDVFGWCIDIHDALVLCAEAATFGRNEYAKGLESDYKNRNKILTAYFKSIGIKASAMKEWREEVVPHIIPFKGEFSCNPLVLK